MEGSVVPLAPGYIQSSLEGNTALCAAMYGSTAAEGGPGLESS